MKMLAMPTARCSKHCAVSTEQESFADYVRRVANEKGLTYREVARRGGISSPSISDIVSGKTIHVKASTISALAKGLGVPEEEVFAAYRGKAQTDLSRSEQRVINFYKEMSPTAQHYFELIGETLSRESKQSPQDIGGSGNGRKDRLIPPGGRRMPVITKGADKSSEQEKKRA
jgi:transcriptional regulator with XRE-family HTH domain